MSLRRPILQWGGFIAVAILADAVVQPQGYLETVLLGLVVVLVYFPGLSYLSRNAARKREGLTGSEPAQGQPNVEVTHSRLSGTSSILMIALGVFTLFFVSGFFGLVLIVAGYLMFRFSRRGTKSEAASGPSVPPGAAA